MDMFYHLPVKYIPSTHRNALVKRQRQIMFSFNSKIFYFQLESKYASVLQLSQNCAVSLKKVKNDPRCPPPLPHKSDNFHFF